MQIPFTSKQIRIRGSWSPLSVSLQVIKFALEGKSGYEEREDLLSRRKFARDIADYITWRGEESQVIAIYGKWGEGKTFLKDMVMEEIYGVEELGSSSETLPVVEYNPWEWSNQKKLYEGFFRTLEEKFRKLGETSGTFAEEYERLANDLRASSHKWNQYTPSVSKLKSSNWAIGVAAGYLSVSSLPFSKWLASITSEPWAQEAAANLEMVLGVALLVLLIPWFISAILSGRAKYMEAQAKASERSLDEIKAEIRSTLQKLGEPVLVVIDDVDRLDAEQIRMVMQLVKANADFPNVTYLILFERRIVEKSLDDEKNGIDGQRYLQKIVHRGYDLPAINKATLLEIFDERLNDALDGEIPEHVKGNLEASRFAKLIINPVSDYLRTLRDVDRLLATLPFYLKLYINRENIDINVVDLFALEVIRVFESEIYRSIQRFKETLTLSWPTINDTDDSFKVHCREVLARLLETADETNEQAAKEIVRELFPVLKWAESAGSGAVFTCPIHEWEANLRICHSDIFDRYFERAIEKDELSQHEIDWIINRNNTGSFFVNKWNSLIERGKMKSALLNIGEHIDEIDPDTYSQFTSSLFNVGDRISGLEGDGFTPSAFYYAQNLVTKMLQKADEPRGHILKEAIKSSEEPYLATWIVDSLLRDSSDAEEGSQTQHLYSEPTINELKELCVSKIEEAAVDGLEEHPHLLYLMTRWHDWGDSDKASAWINARAEGGKSRVFGILKGFQTLAKANERQAISSKHGESHTLIIAVEWLEKLAVLDTIENELQRLECEDLTDEEEALVSKFRLSKELLPSRDTDTPNAEKADGQ